MRSHHRVGQGLGLAAAQAFAAAGCHVVFERLCRFPSRRRHPIARSRTSTVFARYAAARTFAVRTRSSR